VVCIVGLCDDGGNRVYLPSAACQRKEVKSTLEVEDKLMKT
jgi:hypothetical protein